MQDKLGQKIVREQEVFLPVMQTCRLMGDAHRQPRPMQTCDIGKREWS